MEAFPSGALEEGPGPRATPLREVAAWVGCWWPHARFAGLTSRGWPYLGGRFLKEGYPTPWGIVWVDGPKTCWAWQPREVY